MPTHRTSAVIVRTSVAGSRSMISSVTGRPALMPRPRSPWMMPLSPPPMNLGRKFSPPCSLVKASRPSLLQLRMPNQPPNSMAMLTGVTSRLEAPSAEPCVAIRLGQRLDPRQRVLRAAGRQAHEREADDHDPEEQRQQAEDPADDVLDHGLCCLLRASVMPGSRVLARWFSRTPRQEPRHRDAFRCAGV